MIDMAIGLFSQASAGELQLKIAQLERRLKILEQQQVLSRPYPELSAKLLEQSLQVRLQLEQLRQNVASASD